jgi:pyruvate dehydrogenase E2 component (dihydrolipoamide acetyltransferase)
LALDLPGHGGSPLGAVTDFSTLVDAAEAALAASGLGPIDLVGHSLGAAVSAAVAARGTLDIRSLLLVSPAGLGPAINGAFMRGFLGAGSEASLTPWMHELVADPAALTPAFVRATLKAREGTDLVATQRRIAEAVFPDDTQSFSIRPDLARLAIPTRIVFGAADRIIPARHATGLPGAVALHLFPGVGHMPHIEDKEAIARIAAEMARSA